MTIGSNACMEIMTTTSQCTCICGKKKGVETRALFDKYCSKDILCT